MAWSSEVLSWTALTVFTISCVLQTCYGQGGNQDQNGILVCDSVEKADIVFVLDSSGSINETRSAQGIYNNWFLARESIIKIVDEIDKDQEIGIDQWRIGLVTFSALVHNIFYLRDSTSKESVVNLVRNAFFLGSDTNTAGAIKVAREQQFDFQFGDRPGVPNVMIIITDGESTKQRERTVPEAQLCHDQNIAVFSVGITTRINVEELKSVSSPPHIENENWFRSATFNFDDTIVSQITTQTCKEIKVRQPTIQPTVCDDKWRLYAIIAFIVAGIALLGGLSCGWMAIALSSKVSKLKKQMKSKA